MNVLFLKPMECASVQNLPTIAGWTYEIKLDGYRLQAHRLADRVVLYSRRGNVKKFPEIAKELEQLPAGTILDGELAALDDQGRPRFNLLQNYRSASAPPVLAVKKPRPARVRYPPRVYRA